MRCCHIFVPSLLQLFLHVQMYAPYSVGHLGLAGYVPGLPPVTGVGYPAFPPTSGLISPTSGLISPTSGLHPHAPSLLTSTSGGGGLHNGQPLLIPAQVCKMLG